MPKTTIARSVQNAASRVRGVAAESHVNAQTQSAERTTDVQKQSTSQATNHSSQSGSAVQLRGKELDEQDATLAPRSAGPPNIKFAYNEGTLAQMAAGDEVAAAQRNGDLSRSSRVANQQQSPAVGSVENGFAFFQAACEKRAAFFKVSCGRARWKGEAFSTAVHRHRQPRHSPPRPARPHPPSPAQRTSVCPPKKSRRPRISP